MKKQLSKKVSFQTTLSFQTTRGIEATLEQSMDGITWVADQFIKGPYLIQINLEEPYYKFFRISFQEVETIETKKRRTHVRLKKKSN